MGESLKADGKIPWALNLAQAAAGAFTVFYTDIFLANELKATSLSFWCVFKRGGFCHLSPLLYDACSAEKAQDFICPQESISLDSVGFYNTFPFSTLRGRNFVPEEMADILVNHCTGCSGYKGSAWLARYKSPVSRYSLIKIQTAKEGN